MKFEDVLPLLRAGRFVTNLDWDSIKTGKIEYIFKSSMWNNSIEKSIIAHFIAHKKTNGSVVPWMPVDLFSNSWILVDDLSEELERDFIE